MIQLLLIIHLALLGLTPEATYRHDLMVNISQINDTRHEIYIAVSRQSRDFPDHPDVIKIVKVSPSGKSIASISIADVPYGKYAIMIFQDMNGNQKLDKGFLGIPSEPFAFSNNVHPMFRAPRWKECEIDYNPEAFTFTIKGFIRL